MEEKIFNWDDEISNESSGFDLIPEGDYDFTVEKFERGQHDGSDKIPACKKAIVTFTIWGANDKISITENFFLCSKMEWKLSSLFLALGLKKHGEPLKMNWSEITGRKGKCHVYVDTFKKKDDEPGEKTGKSNKIKKFYAYDEDVTTVQPNTTSSAPAGGWTPGQF